MEREGAAGLRGEAAHRRTVAFLRSAAVASFAVVRHSGPVIGGRCVLIWAAPGQAKKNEPVRDIPEGEDLAEAMN